MLKNSPRLRETYAGEPFNELVDRRTVFKILKECRYGYARATKKPGAAVALSIVLNGITGRPINHDESIALGGKLASFETSPQIGGAASNHQRLFGAKRGGTKRNVH